MEIVKIACDLDGVLVDFAGGVIRAAGEDPAGMTQEEKENFLQRFSTKELWRTVGRVEDFWVSLDWTEDGPILWDYIAPYHPFILSGVSMDKKCASQKRIWCARELGDHVEVVTCFAREKQNYANPQTLLIDDKEKNCQQWAAKGGPFILHRNAEETIEQLKLFGF